MEHSQKYEAEMLNHAKDVEELRRVREELADVKQQVCIIYTYIIVVGIAIAITYNQFVSFLLFCFLDNSYHFKQHLHIIHIFINKTTKPSCQKLKPKKKMPITKHRLRVMHWKNKGRDSVRLICLHTLTVLQFMHRLHFSCHL